MRMIRGKILAVCMAALLMLPEMSVSAAELTQPMGPETAEMETVAILSGNDADNIASGVDGDITWVIDAGGKLTVTGTGDLSGDHASDSFAWRPYSSQITSAEVNVSGMVNASALFYNCENMVSVDVSGFDTGSVTSMNHMFSGCSSLTSVDASSFDTSNVTDMYCMFFGCSGLMSVDVSGFDTSNVTNMENMFGGCSGLTSVDVSGFDTSSVINMDSMFYGCSSLTSADVSNFDTRNVTNMMGMFYGCSSLTNLDVSGFSTGNVVSMGLMFGECSSLMSVNITGFNTRSVTDMGHMFFDCSSLTSVDVNGFDTSNVTDMAFMFANCSGLTSVDVSGFNTSNVTNMFYMFFGCNGLTSVDVSGFDTSNVTHMVSMFANCSGLTSLDVSGFNTSNVTGMSGMFSGCRSLTSLDVSSFDTGNVTDMSEMFWGCSSLTNLDVSGFNTGNVASMGLMFHECSSLTSLDVSGFATGNVTNMNAMFAGCSGLTSLDVAGFDTSKVTDMGMMFTDCSGLTGLDVGGFDTGSVTSMNGIFSGCSALTDLDVSGFDIGNVTEESHSVGMFADCDNLVTLQSPCNVNIAVSLPFVQGTEWLLADGTQVTKLPQSLSYSVTLTRSDVPSTPQITTTTPDLNMEDVVRVKYVPYSYTVETNADEEDTVTFSIEEGRLADGLQMYPATGEIYGVPLEAGEFKITVKAAYSNPEYPPAYAELTLIVLDNTDDNVDVASDPGYDITQPVADFDMDSVPGDGTQTLVSQGEYSQFRDVYIDGRKLAAGQDYTSAPGSTRITILNQTLADGGEGTHTLGIEFRTEDGALKRAAQNYVIKADAGENSTPQPAPTETPQPTPTETPQPTPTETPQSAPTETPQPTPTETPQPASTETPQPDFLIYAVERGDSLWKIAARFYGQGSSWRVIYEDNAAVIKNPGRLYIGQQLVIRLAQTPADDISVTPVATPNTVPLEGTTYKVQKGDRLWTIAQRAYGRGGLWTIIYEANKDIIADPERIRQGQVIAIPQRQ